jgi:hypothetical protein
VRFWDLVKMNLMHLHFTAHRTIAPEDRAAHFETLTDIFFCSSSMEAPLAGNGGGATGISTTITQIAKVGVLNQGVRTVIRHLRHHHTLSSMSY